MRPSRRRSYGNCSASRQASRQSGLFRQAARSAAGARWSGRRAGTTCAAPTARPANTWHHAVRTADQDTPAIEPRDQGGGDMLKPGLQCNNPASAPGAGGAWWYCGRTPAGSGRAAGTGTRPRAGSPHNSKRQPDTAPDVAADNLRKKNAKDRNCDRHDDSGVDGDRDDHVSLQLLQRRAVGMHTGRGGRRPARRRNRPTGEPRRSERGGESGVTTVAETRRH